MSLIYFFGDGKADGGAEDKALLGGKGANLAEMTRMGLPVPPGFTLSTAICNHTFANDGAWPEGCLLYTSPSPRDATLSRMPSSA